MGPGRQPHRASAAHAPQCLDQRTCAGFAIRAIWGRHNPGPLTLDTMPGELNYCARCGAPLTWHAASAHEPPVLGCSDPACGRNAYRNAKSCAGVLVEDGG